MNPIFEFTFSLAPAVAAGPVPAVWVWGTALVWVIVALLLASVAGIVAGGTRQESGRRPEICRPIRTRLQACTACAR